MSTDEPLPTGIRKTAYGFQAYIWVDGHQRSKRFPKTATLTAMKTWRHQRRVSDDLGVTLDDHPLTGARFSEDIDTYDKAITTLPSYKNRMRDLKDWPPTFGHLPRKAITPVAIRIQRERWLTVGPRRVFDRKTQAYIAIKAPLSASTVNHRVKALRNFFTVLDPGGYNPAAEIGDVDESASAQPRDIELGIALAIIKALPAKVDSAARLKLIAFTGWPHAQVKTLDPSRIDWKARAVWMPPRKKGRKKKVLVPGYWLPVMPIALSALREMKALGCWGWFSNSGLHKFWRRHLRALIQAGKIPAEAIAYRPYDLRHTFATALGMVTDDERAMQRLLMSAQPRYSQKATDPRTVKALRSLVAYLDSASGRVPAVKQRKAKEGRKRNGQ